MSSLSNTLALAKRLQQLSGPEAAPKRDPSPLPSTSSSFLQLPTPRDLHGPLLQLGVVPALAARLAKDYQHHARKLAQSVILSHDHLNTILHQASSRLGPALTPPERATFSSGHDAAVSSIGTQRYLAHLQSMEQKIFELVAAKRARFSPPRDRRQVQRKGFAKVRPLSSPPFPLFAPPRLELTSASPSHLFSQKSVEILRKVRTHPSSSSSIPFDGDGRAHLHRSTSSSAAHLHRSTSSSRTPTSPSSGSSRPTSTWTTSRRAYGYVLAHALFAFVRRSLVISIVRVDGRRFPLMSRPPRPPFLSAR